MSREDQINQLMKDCTAIYQAVRSPDLDWQETYDFAFEQCKVISKIKDLGWEIEYVDPDGSYEDDVKALDNYLQTKILSKCSWSLRLLDPPDVHIRLSKEDFCKLESYLQANEWRLSDSKIMDRFLEAVKEARNDYFLPDHFKPID
jgi:hypothetical protein